MKIKIHKIKSVLVMTKKELEERTQEELDNELSKLRAKMRDGEVKFKFKKKDGSVRTAIGTLNKKLIPKEFVNDERRKPSDVVMNYFDVEKEDWRCFRKENFLEIVK